MNGYKENNTLLLYKTENYLNKSKLHDIDKECREILSSLIDRGLNSLTSLGYHVWDDYVKYLEAKDPFFPFWNTDPFYHNVYLAFEEDKKETRKHTDIFYNGKVPTITDIELILGRLVQKTLLGIDLTLIFRKKGFNNAFSYNTWEYKPIVEIVCTHRKIKPSSWCKIQQTEISDSWKCLEEAYKTVQPSKYAERGIFHFVKKTSEGTLLQEAALEAQEAWNIHEGDTNKVKRKLTQGISESIDILTTSKVSRYFTNLRAAYENSSGLLGVPSLPFLPVQKAIDQLEKWRLINKIPAYAHLFILKYGGPLLDLPKLRPPFGPKGKEENEAALQALQRSRWLKWDE